MKRTSAIVSLVAISIAVMLQVPAAGGIRSAVLPQPVAHRSGARPYIGTRPSSNPGGVGVAALPTPSTSTNWSGYTVQTSFPTGASGSVSDARATWVVPTVTGGAGDAYSANWVGIDGYSSPTVEQIGTGQDWTSGRPSYYAWWEMYPGSSFEIPSLSINPGDVMTAEVQWVTGSQFRLTLTDVTAAQTFTTLQTVIGGAQRRSAEWVVEAPSSGTAVLPLADIGPSSFTSCTVTVNGAEGSISGATWQYEPMTLISGPSGATLAQPSSLASAGSAFVVTRPGIDTIPPVTTSDAAASYNNVALIHLSAADDLGGSGVAATHYRVDGGATQTGNVVTVSTYGLHMLTFWSVDAVGNIESAHTVSLMVNDTIPPTTVSNSVSAYVGVALIRLTATDNPGGSGIAVTHYTVDGVVRKTYAGTPISITATGSHLLTYWSADNAGNDEATHTATFAISPPRATKLSLTASASSIVAGRYLSLSGKLSGGVPAGTSVRYEVRRPGSRAYVLLANRAVSGSGASSYRYRLTRHGTYYFRVRFLGTGSFLGSISASRRVSAR